MKSYSSRSVRIPTVVQLDLHVIRHCMIQHICLRSGHNGLVVVNPSIGLHEAK